MYKTFAIIDIILASHSFLAAFLLFAKRSNQKATLYLGIINLLMGVFFLIAYLSLDSLSSNHAIWVYLVIPLVYFMTPLCYLYTFRLSRTETRNDGYHFIPAFVATVYVLIHWVHRGRYAAGPMENIFSLHYISFDLYLLLQTGLLMLALYLLKMFLIIREYNHEIRHVYSSIEKTNLRWLQIHLGIGTIGCSIFFISNILQYFLPAAFAPVLNRIEYAGQAFCIVFLFSIVYFTFLQQDIGTRASSPVYARQRLGEAREKAYVQRLLSCMEEEKPYLDPELTVQDLSDILEIPAAHLSMILNIHLKQNFYQFINTYRVRYAAELLTEERMRYENILSIALEAGFNSKSSFNTYFKKIQHMTPREYRQKNRSAQGR